MDRRGLSLWLAAAALAAPAMATAEQQGGGSARTAPVDLSPGSAAGYAGVVPGEQNPPPRAERLARTRDTMVTWPGFQVSSAGSRVFVQTTRPVTWRRVDEPSRILIVLENTRIHLRNNGNPLVTEHFDTPLASADLRRQGRDTVLVLQLKVDVQPRIHTSAEGEFHFLFVEFPPGSYPVPRSTTPARGERAGGDGTEGLSIRSVD